MPKGVRKENRPPAAGPVPDRAGIAELRGVAALHLCFGWWSLLGFLTLGLLLESLHALKVGWYLDVDNETRRLLFTLAHAHGTLLSLVNIAYGICCLVVQPGGAAGWSAAASRPLLGAALLLPLGFLLGGVFIDDGDPGIGVLLAPLGAVLLLLAVACAAVGFTQAVRKVESGDEHA